MDSEEAYPTLKGIQFMLDLIAPQLPQAKNAKPEQFVDLSFFQELEKEGFFNEMAKTISEQVRRLEWWSIGVMEYWVYSGTHHSITSNSILLLLCVAASLLIGDNGQQSSSASKSATLR